MKSDFAPPTRFGCISCFVVGVCLSNYNFNFFPIHPAPYSKGYQWYLMHREVFGSIWKIGRYPIKVSEVLRTATLFVSYFNYWNEKTTKQTVKILWRRLIRGPSHLDFHCLQMCVRIYLMSEANWLYSNKNFDGIKRKFVQLFYVKSWINTKYWKPAR